MIRLTELREDGRWGVKGMDWMNIHEGVRIKGKVMELLYGCLCELKAYEDIGFLMRVKHVVQKGIAMYHGKNTQHICPYCERPMEIEQGVYCQYCGQLVK